MKNKNLLAALAVRDPTARVTRARAAASQSTLDASEQQCQKQDSRKNSKRVALDEKNSHAPIYQNKRRAVLKDLNNVCCDNSVRKFSNTTKLMKKNVKQTKRGSVEASKIAPPVAVKIQKNSNPKIGQAAALTEIESAGLLSLDKNAHLEPIAENDNCEDLHAHDVLESGVQQKKEGNKSFVRLEGYSKVAFTDIDLDHKDPQLCREYAPMLMIMYIIYQDSTASRCLFRY